MPVQLITLSPLILLAQTVMTPLPLSLPPTATLTGCRATDGDSIRCGTERLRLSGIDSPEKPGACRRNRRCAPGDPFASQINLATAIADRPLTVYRLGLDKYRRTVALAWAGNTNLSCWQLQRRQAIYRRDWDTAHRVAAICPAAASNRSPSR